MTSHYDAVRGRGIIQSRQHAFAETGRQLYGHQEHPVKVRHEESRSGYGRCAETFIFLLVLQGQ